jgi:putative oxidoreductase
MIRMVDLAGVRRRLVADGWPLFPLRLAIGLGFAVHGFAKLSRGPATFATILAALGIPAPLSMAWITSVLELMGGVALILGAAVAPLALPLAVVVATATVGVHWSYGFLSVRLKSIGPDGAVFGPVGYEMNLLYLAGLAALAMAGPTPLSIDRWLAARRRRPAELKTKA